MKIIHDPRCVEYQRPGHPERPSRITGTLAHLKAQKEYPVEWEPPLEATEEQVARAHAPSLIAIVRNASSDLDADTPAHPNIYHHALRSAGGAIQAMRLSRQGHWTFSLSRPPGHHATRHEAMGFCYFNSIAIAALEALSQGIQRVAVFDFDVHHGNGTEDILLGKSGVSFYSVHQHPCYPGTGAENRGTNMFNYPVPPKLPRMEYRRVLQAALNDLKKSKPEIVGVSAGFDAYARDPLAQETLEPEDFHWLGEQFRQLGIPVFSILEGGYSDDLPTLIHAYLKGLQG